MMTWFEGRSSNFPLAFITARLYFAVFGKVNLRFSSDSVKCVPFVCIPNNDTLFFCECDVVFIFFPSIDYHHPITHLGWWRGHGTKVFNFSKLTPFFTQKNSVIIVDCKLWWFSLLVGVASLMIIWKMSNFLSLMRLPDYFLIIFDLHTSGTK